MEQLVIQKLARVLVDYLREASPESRNNTVEYLKPMLETYKLVVMDDLKHAEQYAELALQSDDGFSRATEEACNNEDFLRMLKNTLEMLLTLPQECAK